MSDQSIKNQILEILKALDDDSTETKSIPDKVINLFDSTDQPGSEKSTSKSRDIALAFRRINFGMACMIFSIFILIAGFVYLDKADPGPFLAASMIVLIIGAWQIDKGNKEQIMQSMR